MSIIGRDYRYDMKVKKYYSSDCNVCGGDILSCLETTRLGEKSNAICENCGQRYWNGGKIKEEVTKQEFETMIVESFRYCLGRRSYAVSECVERTKKYWPKLSDNIKKLILKDIQECIDRGGAGDDCDVREWNSLIEFSKGSNSTGLDRD